MHHRRAEIEFGEIADDGVGIAGARRLAAAALQRLLTEQLRLGNDGQPRFIQEQTLFQGRHDQAEACVTVKKALPVLEQRGMQAIALQYIQQGLAASRGLRGE